MSDRPAKRFKSEGSFGSTVWSRKKRRLWSSGLGRRKFMKSVARTRGPLFASPEVKYWDYGLTAYTTLPQCSAVGLGGDVSCTPYFPTAPGPVRNGCCFAPVLGNDINNRIGRKCAVHKVRINGQVYVPTQLAQTDIDTPFIFRAILFVDKQSNGSQATLNDAFVNNYGINNSFSAINMPQSLSTLGRFKVLKDKKHVIQDFQLIGYPPALGQGGKLYNFKITHKFKKPLIVHFNNTTNGSYVDIVQNCILFNCLVNNNACVPSVQYFGRTVFTDV